MASQLLSWRITGSIVLSSHTIWPSGVPVPQSSQRVVISGSSSPTRANASSSGIVRGKRTQTLPVAKRIARVLGLRVEDIWPE